MPPTLSPQESEDLDGSGDSPTLKPKKQEPIRKYGGGGGDDDDDDDTSDSGMRLSVIIIIAVALSVLCFCLVFWGVKLYRQRGTDNKQGYVSYNSYF